MGPEEESSHANRRFSELPLADRSRLLHEALEDVFWCGRFSMGQPIIHCASACLCTAAVIVAARHYVSVSFLLFLAFQFVLVFALLLLAIRLNFNLHEVNSMTQRDLRRLSDRLKKDDVN